MLDLDSFDFCEANDLQPGQLAMFPELGLGLTIVTNFDNRLVAVPLDQANAEYDWAEIENIRVSAVRITDYIFELDPMTLNSDAALGCLVMRYQTLGIVVKGPRGLYSIPFKEIERDAGHSPLYFPKWEIIKYVGDRRIPIFPSRD